jgi:signal transduction histidine kinase
VTQVLLNLVSNAVKFTPPGGSVTIQAEHAGDSSVEISVTDTGIGITPDKLDSVFDPFVQVDARLTREQSGAGLGLAISRDLARGMGGDLKVRSEPGRGSTFVLTLQRA